jgi:hypothetical protein
MKPYLGLWDILTFPKISSITEKIVGGADFIFSD